MFWVAPTVLLASFGQKDGRPTSGNLPTTPVHVPFGLKTCFLQKEMAIGWRALRTNTFELHPRPCNLICRSPLCLLAVLILGSSTRCSFRSDSHQWCSKSEELLSCKGRHSTRDGFGGFPKFAVALACFDGFWWYYVCSLCMLQQFWQFLVNLFLIKLVRISGFSSLFSAIAVFPEHFARERQKDCDR